MRISSAEEGAGKRAVPDLSSEPCSRKKRLMDFSITAYPSRVNDHLLPPRALAADDFSLIDPLQYRKNHPIANNNISTGSACHSKIDSGIDMMSTSQMASFFMQMGQKLCKNRDLNKDRVTNAKGYYTSRYAPPYNENSTYRADYCQDEPIPFDSRKAEEEKDYRGGWNDQEKGEIAVSSKIPYMTLPESLLAHERNTIYRESLMPEAERDDFRTLSHFTYLPELGTSFAYSAYGENDPRRNINFNPKIAALKNPKSFLEKTSEESGYDPKKVKETHDELEYLRAARREKMAKKRELEQQRSVQKKVHFCGLRDAGFRNPPNGKSDYVFLPQKFVF